MFQISVENQRNHPFIYQRLYKLSCCLQMKTENGNIVEETRFFFASSRIISMINIKTNALFKSTRCFNFLQKSNLSANHPGNKLRQSSLHKRKKLIL